jgi:hypothetical protein
MTSQQFQRFDNMTNQNGCERNCKKRIRPIAQLQTAGCSNLTLAVGARVVTLRGRPISEQFRPAAGTPRRPGGRLRVRHCGEGSRTCNGASSSRAAARPFAAHAQQPAMPLIGFLSSRSPRRVCRRCRRLSPGPKRNPALSKGQMFTSPSAGRRGNLLGCPRSRRSWCKLG